MKKELLDNDSLPQQPQPTVESTQPVNREKILEGHCRLAVAILRDKTPQEKLLEILRRVYKSGQDLDLQISNFTEDFQTPEISKALDTFAQRNSKSGTKK